MGKSVAPGKAEVTISAKVIRANGEVEDLGVVSRQRVEKSSFISKLFKRKNYGNRINRHR